MSAGRHQTWTGEEVRGILARENATRLALKTERARQYTEQAQRDPKAGHYKVLALVQLAVADLERDYWAARLDARVMSYILTGHVETETEPASG